MLLLGWSLRHPLWMLATLKATSRTMRIVQEKFPYIHGKDNKANAFRHALWNCFIALKCFELDTNLNTVLAWTKRITDWHEDFSPNSALPRTMDEHNNQIGREVFQQCRSKGEGELLRQVAFKVASAIQVSSMKELDQCLGNLVFINYDV